ncbi:MAG: PAS domain-containing sensor histidine kinase [Candidatus Melainabacteria bacterium]|nr:PAS domain-containing sensor histidine kinase [Candidatus Melainabacteria bacterium]
MRISQAGFILVLVPVLFQVVFVSVLLFEIQKTDEIIDAQSRSKLIQFEFRSIIQKAQRAGMELGKYSSLGKDPENLAKCQRLLKEIDSDTRQLRKHVVGEPQYATAMAKFDISWNSLKESMSTAQHMIDMPGNASQMDLMMLYQSVEEKLNEMNNQVKGLSIYENESGKDAAQHRQSARSSLHTMIWWSVGVNVVIAFLLAYWYSRRIGSRVEVLMDNSLRLGRGAPLNPPIHGSDEIARLDRTFHTVAKVITEGSARERALFDNAVDVICALDSSGRITKVNSAFENTFGYELNDVLECHLLEFIFSEDQATTFDFLQNVKDKSLSGNQLENRVSTKTGGTKNVRWSVTWGESHKSYFCVAHDITERKALELAKQDFVNMVSHDLRSPLTALQGTFELFLKGIYGDIQEKGVSRLESAQKSVDRLIALINDLLDIEKLESGEMDISRSKVSAEDIMQDSVEAVRGLAEMNQVVVEVEECDLVVFADPDRLLQVFVNLLSNAIKFSPTSGIVTLSAVAIDDFVEFRIKDQGPGIPPSYLESIFQRFKQVNRSDHIKKKGSGLGLAISKEIVRAHGGTIGVNSAPGEGSTFWFRIDSRT